LGLPPGSIRGGLCLLIVIQLWLLLLLPDSYHVPIPVSLYLLMTLVAVFFVSHGKSIALKSDPIPSPFHLPGGTLRLLIFGGSVAVIGFVYVNHPDRLAERLRPDEAQWNVWPGVVSAYVLGFFVGYLLRLMPFRNNWGLQAFQAWLSIIAMALLFIEIIIQAFVNPSLNAKIDLRTWEAIVTGVTTCYFGTRS
jgi:hypothetical protein